MKKVSLLVSIILCLTLLLTLGATGVFAAEENQSNVVSDWGMTLNDEIVVNFKMTVADGTDVTVTVGERNVSAAVSGGILRVPVYATELDAEICISVGEETNTFKVVDYCESLLASEVYANYHQLVKELLNYGHAAQMYFNNSSNITVEGAGNQDVPATGGSVSISDKSEALKCTGASLVYRDKIALRFYFEGSLEGCTFSVVGANATPVANAEGSYVEVADIMPYDLDKSVTLTACDENEGTIGVTYSPMTYIVRMSQKGIPKTKTLVKALYNYHLAAKNFVPTQYCEVSFDLGYSGEAIETMTVIAGGTYGPLPTPATREGYTFEGWFTSDSFEGEAVTAEGVVTETHTLYAKWAEVVPDEPDEPAESTLVARNPAYLSEATPDELAAVGITDATGTVYRFTKGVGSADMSNGDYALWLENRNGDAYVTFDVRYSEAAGKNPYLLVVTKTGEYRTPGNSGITFVKKGTDISATESDGAYNWIELNTWYTVTVPMAALSEIYLGWDTNDSATVFITNIVWTAPAAPAEAGIVATGSLSVATREELNAAGIKDAGTTYLFNRVASGVDKLLLNNQSNNLYVTFDIRYSAFNNVSDPAVGASYLLLTSDGGKTWFTAGSNGVTIVEKGTETAAGVSGVYNQVASGTWYTVTVPVAGIDNLQISFNGKDSATVLIANVTWTPSVAPEEVGLVARTPDFLNVATWSELNAAGMGDTTDTVYRFTKGVGSADMSNGDYALWLENRNGDAYVTFDVRYSEAAGKNPYLLVVTKTGEYRTPGNSGITFVKKGTDISATESDGAYNWIELNTWYTVTVPMAALSEIYLGWDTNDSATVFITNIVWTPAVAPEEVGLVARTPDFLNVATWSELNAAGMGDTTGTVYRFTKGVGSADMSNGDYALWLENRNGDAYVTFDVRYSEAAGKNPYLLVVTKTGEYRTPGNSGITFVKKGTDISATESDGAYNWIELNTWYTVTVPMAALSEIYLGWDTNDSATVFITNIVWTAPAAPAEAGVVATGSLSVATREELNAAGIKDAGTTYLFNRVASGVDKLYLENQSGNAYVTFDVQYSAFNFISEAGQSGRAYLLLTPNNGGTWLTTGSNGITIVKKGTDTAAEVFSGAYNLLELNTWYTVTVPVQDVSQLQVEFNMADSATMLITNVVWHD